jgi:hypothetical protein
MAHAPKTIDELKRKLGLIETQFGYISEFLAKGDKLGAYNAFIVAETFAGELAYETKDARLCLGLELRKGD